MYNIRVTYISSVLSEKIEIHSNDQIQKARIFVWCAMNGIYMLCGKMKVQLITSTLVLKHSNYLMHVSIFNMWIWDLGLGFEHLIQYSLFIVHDIRWNRTCVNFGKEKKYGLLDWKYVTNFEEQVSDRVSYLFKYLPVGLWLWLSLPFIDRKNYVYDLTTYQMPMMGTKYGKPM